MGTEKDRMLKGETFNFKDPQLVEERFLTSKLVTAFKTSTDKDKSLEILKSLLGAVSDDVWIEPPLYVEYGKNTYLGKKVIINYQCVLLDACPITIGDSAVFGPCVQVNASTHPTDPAARQSERQSFAKPVDIGSNVWLGGRVRIHPGVKIGNNSVIGAGSVVTMDIPPNSLVVGNPGRVIRTLSDETCKECIRTEIGSEKERMLRGELYNSLDPQLCQDRSRCVSLTTAFNATSDSEDQKRQDIVKKLFGKVGGGSQVEPPFLCDYGTNITLGKNARIGPSCSILDGCAVTIGDNVVLGCGVHVYAATHPLGPSLRQSCWEYAKPINIGSDVWIGNGSILCPGVSIGNGSVIGAGSVVCKDIPPNVFAVGNPCRVIEDTHTDV